MGSLNSEFWSSKEGLTARFSMLGEYVQNRSFNRALQVYAVAAGVTDFVVSGKVSSNTCDWCRSHVGTVYRKGMFMPFLPKHPHCFLAETLVKTESGLKPISQIKLGEKVLTHRGRYRPVVYLHKNQYDGKIRKLGDVSATSDHPFLTEKGWVRADSVNDVADVLRGKVNRDFEPFLQGLNLKTNQYPSTVAQQNFFAFIASLLLGTRCMPVSPINLYGDFAVRDSEVNIVDVYGVMRNNVLNSVLFVGFEEPCFEFGESWRVLDRYGMINLFIMASLFMRGYMSSFKLCKPLLGGHFCPAQMSNFSAAASFHSCIDKSFPNHALRDSEFISDGLLLPSCLIEFNNFTHGDVLSKLHVVLPTMCNSGYNYKGFVYNLAVKEDESYCVGEQQLVVHNCVHYFDVLRIGSPPSPTSTFSNVE